MEHTILIVDDHPVFRQGLHNLLEKQEDMFVVGEAEDGRTAIGLVREKKPDIVIMDINMPAMNGIDATRRIVSEFPDTRIIALSVNSEKSFVRNMLEAGASGYILKESVPEEIVEGIRTALSGNTALSRSISNLLVSDYKALLSVSEAGEAEENLSVLSTKLYPPPLVSHIIPRTRLIEVLEKGAEGAMTLIAAPAGYGKSILASQWLSVSGFSGAWVSLDENDNDVRCFVNYIVEAIQRLFPGGEWETRSLMKAARLPSAQEIGRHLLNDLEKIDNRFILVLDDYHCIRNAVIHDLVETLMAYPSPSMHLVLVTRRDPPLSLVSLRGRGLLIEIASREISFSVSETQAFLERFLRIDISEETVRLLQEKMEGWVAGLHLAALSIGKRGDQKHLIDGLRGTLKLVREYLIEEVFSRMPPIIRENILKTAFLDRFCAPMCDAVFSPDSKRDLSKERMSGQQFIDWLIHNGMFAIPVDSGNRWVRYHPVFQQLLQEQAAMQWQAEQIAALHCLAGVWLSENGFVDDAVNHLLAVGETAAAAGIIERYRRGFLDAEQWHTLDKWLDRLPPEVRMERPELLICRAWIFLMERRIADIRPIVVRVESLLADNSKHPELDPELDFFRGLLCYFDGQGACSVALLKNVRKLPPKRLFAALRVKVDFWLGMALHLESRKAEAFRILNRNIGDRDFQNAKFLSQWVYGLCAIHLLDGEFPLAFREGQRMLEICGSYGLDELEAIATHMLGNISLQMFDLETARNYLRQVYEKRYAVDDRTVVDAMAGLAMTCCFRGNGDGVAEAMRLGKMYADGAQSPLYHEVMNSCQARLNLLQGNIGTSYCWQKSVDHSHGNPVMLFFMENPDITQCRVLVAVGSEASLEKAASMLDKLRQNAKKWRNTRLLLEVMVLQALALHRQGRLNDPMTILEEVLLIAEPNGWIRPFVEPGSIMIDQLHRLLNRNIAPIFIERILSVHEEIENVSGSIIVKHGDKTVREHEIRVPTEPRTLLEPMTNREMDVLELLARRFQNKEIADRLFISIDTVKGHLKNIFQKLGAVNRRDAVEKAKRLKIV